MKKPEEIIGGCARDNLGRDGSNLRHLLGDIAHEGGFIGFSAKRYRREIGTVGLNQQAVGGDTARDVSQGLLRGVDARTPIKGEFA